MNMDIQVIKRDGYKQDLCFNKVLDRIKNLCFDKNLTPLNNVKYAMIALETIKGIYPNIQTCELDELAARIAQPMSLDHPEYGILASRILISNHQKNTFCYLKKENPNVSDAELNQNMFKYVSKLLYENKDPMGNQHPLIHPKIYYVIQKYSQKLETIIDYTRDYEFDFIGFKMLEESYLQKCSAMNCDKPRIVIERPQHLFMRVALGIHCGPYEIRNKLINWFSIDEILQKYLTEKQLIKMVRRSGIKEINWDNVINDIKDQKHDPDDLQKIYDLQKEKLTWNELSELYTYFIPDALWDEIIETYDMLSKKYFIHATPTLFNSGTLTPQFSSCFLMQVAHDSLADIADYWKNCSRISKYSGGIGSHVHNIRAQGSYIASTNGISNGLVPMLKVVNEISVYVDQCFHPDTKIYTLDGVKNISEITYNDKLLTSNGTFQKIDKIRHFNRKCLIYKITTAFSQKPILITGEHPILVKRHGNNRDYIQVKDLTIFNSICFHVPQYVKDLSFSEEACLIYAIIQRYGYVENPKNPTFIVKIPKYSIYMFVINYLKTSNIPYDDLLLYISWKNHLTFPFTYSMFYKNGVKRISSDILHLPKSKLYCILLIFFGYSSDLPIDESLCDDLKYLLLRFGITNYSNPVSEIMTNLYKDEKFIETPIQKIEISEYNGPLIDFDVIASENQKNYTTELGIAHNGGNKRPGSHAIYIELWHADIFNVISLKKGRGNETERARNLFYAMWICDEFMRRLKYEIEHPDIGPMWYLMSPDQSQDLSNLYDESFNTNWISDQEINENKQQYAFTFQYREYINQKKYIQVVSATSLWRHICDVIIETGIPYILMKDACNRKSNQKNLGTIKSSNLCVAPDTLILTEYGHVEIARLENQKIKVWNSQKFSETIIRKTSINTLLYKITFNDGSYIKCTENHKFPIYKRESSKNSWVFVNTLNLKIYDKLLVLKNLPYIEKECPTSAESRLEWVRLQLAGKSICFKDDHIIIIIESPFKMKLTLQTLGIYSEITDNEIIIPFEELIKNKYKIIPRIFTDAIELTDAISYDPKPLYVVKIEILHESDAYCFTEPLLNLGVFNGLCLGNCTEIIEYSSSTETAVCNLSSTNLTSIISTHPLLATDNPCPEFSVFHIKPVDELKQYRFDWNLLERIIRRQVKNLNKIIDINFYPISSAKNSNLLHRPIGIGVQDFANMLTVLRVPFDSEEALKINFYLFEFIYYIACDESANIARARGYPYKSFPNSPASKGKLQIDLWIEEQGESSIMFPLSLDWDTLRQKIKKFGLSNSLMIALMPTGSTSTILGCSPCFEPHNSIVYKRRNKIGENIIINKYLFNDLILRELWTPNIKNQLLLSKTGSIAEIKEIPQEIRDIYKTVWDISPKITSNMCLSRGPFIDQSQSYSLFIPRPTHNILTKIHFYNWQKGIKTSSYYTRRLAVVDAAKLQVNESEPSVCTPGCKSCEA